MTGAELAAEIAEAIAQDSRLDAIREKIEAGTADLKDSELYTAICAEITGRMMRGAVAGLDDREESFTEIARERYRETFDIYSAVQAIIDRALGIRIAAQEPGFQEDRARKIGHALEDQTVPESTILRRAESASKNFVMSQHDRCVEENAKFRDRAGLQSYAVRTGGAKCCQWCADVSGKYPANETPDGFWGRHDNCKCSILYESRRGTQLLGGTSKKWEVVAEGAGAGELHRLSGDETAAAGAPEPVVFTKEQAKAIQAKKGLTNLSENGTIKEERFRIGKPVPFTEKSYEMMLNKQSYVAAIVQKYNIHLRGSGRKISIVIDYTIPAAGKSCEIEPDIIRLGQAAFYDEIQLANTIAHELNHCRSWLKGGNAPEGLAYHAGDTLESFIRGEL